MKYPNLTEPCKSAIAEGRCLGCQALENPFFTGNKKCNLYERRKDEGIRTVCRNSLYK